ncbi:MAG: YicC family protein [Candidatus Eisenbacteria sp.]|nr:YicC family protein [Candidatus Eisenbacteria bacterium]
MIHSMTGYGRAEIREDGVDLSVELRSVNHRFLDISLRLPKSLASLEARAKELIGRRLSRGRVSGTLAWGNSGGDTEAISIDREVADRYHALLCDLKANYDLAGEVDLTTMAARPDIWKVERRELDLDALWTYVDRGLEQSLDELIDTRAREGKELAKDLSERVNVIRRMGEEIAVWMPQKTENARDKLCERLEKLISMPEIPPERLAMEATILADRMDCTEECVRLRIHCDHFHQYLLEGGPVGRKLNFLLQEMGRESNTIGSKANDAEVSQQVVRLKEEVEKLREQVQNIE